LPSGKQMVAIKIKNKCLNRRSIPQIRSWIHNQISKKSKSRLNGNKVFEKKIFLYLLYLYDLVLYYEFLYKNMKT